MNNRSCLAAVVMTGCLMLAVHAEYLCAQEGAVGPLFAAPVQEPDAASTFQPHRIPSAEEQQIELGRPNQFVDGIGWFLGIPRKLLLWDRRVENHAISPETQVEVAEYLAVNDLKETKVRINQYNPGGEWRRLVANKRVGAGWRYTVGAFHTLGYTLLPGRLFGGDSYNAYTDTVHIYSDVPALALEQAAYAKDVHQHNHPGTYATIQSLPLLGLTHERRSKQDVHFYLSEVGTPQERAEAHRVLTPQFGTEIGGQMGALVPAASLPLEITGAAVGHLVGRRQASGVEVAK